MKFALAAVDITGEPEEYRDNQKLDDVLPNEMASEASRRIASTTFRPWEQKILSRL